MFFLKAQQNNLLRLRLKRHNPLGELQRAAAMQGDVNDTE
jgi:hypothetical protein